MYMYIYIYIYTYTHVYLNMCLSLSLYVDIICMYLYVDNNYLSTGYGVRLSTEIYGSKRERTFFYENLQEARFVISAISEQSPEDSGRRKSRNPVFKIPLTEWVCQLLCPDRVGRRRIDRSSLGLRIWPISILRFWISEGLTQAY